MTLNKIIDNIGFKKMTGWIQLYAEKLEDEGKNEIIILNIDREDLENQIPNTLEARVCRICKLGGLKNLYFR